MCVCVCVWDESVGECMCVADDGNDGHLRAAGDAAPRRRRVSQLKRVIVLACGGGKFCRPKRKFDQVPEMISEITCSA